VLADRGWGAAMFYPLFGENVGYPSMQIAAPDLTIVGSQAGFDDFITRVTMLRTHAMMR
jgi:hypothetical protein